MSDSCCVPATLLTVTSLAAAIAMSGVIFSSLLMSSSTDVLGVVPETISVALLVLFLFVMAVSCCGVSGTLLANRVLLGSYLCVSILVIIAQFFFGTYALLYANNIETFGGLDSATAGLTIDLEDAVVDWGININPSGYVDLQTSLDCCGVNLRSTYERNTTLPTLLSGPECLNTTRLDAIIDVQTTFPVYGEPAEDYADGLDTLGEDFFCSAAIGSAIREYTLYLAIGFGLLIATQLAAAACASILIFCTRYEDYADSDDEDSDGRGTDSDTEDPRRAYRTGRGTSIRLSRARFAPTQPGGVGAGMGASMNRLSRSFGGTRPPPGLSFDSEGSTNKAAREQQTQGRGLMNRLSSRMPFFQPRQPMGPPPGFDDTPASTASLNSTGGGGQPPEPPQAPNFMKRLSNRMMRTPGGPPPTGPPPGMNKSSPNPSFDITPAATPPLARAAPPPVAAAPKVAAPKPKKLAVAGGGAGAGRGDLMAQIRAARGE